MAVVVHGTPTVGSALLLSCMVNVIDGLVAQPEIVWEMCPTSVRAINGTLACSSQSAMFDDAELNNAQYNTSLTISTFSTSDAGMYTCQAIVHIASINVTIADEVSQNVSAQG